jgi:hypothetical protein
MFATATQVARSILTCAVITLSISAADADTIRLTHAGHASGRLAGVDFPDSAFVIEATADTADRQAMEGGTFVLVHDAASISIKGLGTFDFITPTQTFVNNEVAVVGISVENAFDLVDGPFDEVFATWDMLGSIGPISGDGIVLQWMTEDVITSGGVLVLNDGTPVITFTAEVANSCYADLNGDAAIDLFDFLAFTNLFNAQDPDADCDQSGAFDLFDFLCYTNAFNEGC